MFSNNIKNNKKGGFTLIELLIVVAIIGVLAGIVVISISGSTDDAKEAARKSNLRAMGTVYAQAQAISLDGTTIALKNFCHDMGSGGEIDGLDNQVESIMGTVFASISGGNTSEATGTSSDAATYLHTAVGGGSKVLPKAGCASSDNGWVVWTELSGTDYWCIDSAGFSGKESISGDVLTTNGKIGIAEVNCTEISS